VETTTLGNVDIFVRSGLDIDPYFPILMPTPQVGWWKAWFLLWNDTDVPLSMLMGSCPVPHPNGGYGVAQMDLHML
jgi:hypothetical protein